MDARDLSAFIGRRNGRLGSHQNSPVPMMTAPSMSVLAIAHDPSGGIYDESLAIGTVPDHPFPYAWAVSRVWFIVGEAESGETGENFTAVEFYSGDNFATATLLATLTTEAGPAAGAQVTQALRDRRVDSGQTLFVVPSRTGTLSVNYDLKRITFGFDLVGVRVG